jgi:hypothetical protein
MQDSTPSQGRRCEMNSVLLQEERLEAAAEETSIPVDIEVNPGPKQEVWFTPVKAAEYTIDLETITLVGSGGDPREFRLTFTLSPASVEAGYRLMNPAIKFFQGGSESAGFRVSPDAGKLSVRATLFNTLAPGEPSVHDRFSILVDPPVGRSFAHDPTIVWNPPNG